MKKKIAVLLKVAGVITAISVIAGIAAFIKERIDEKKEKPFIDGKGGNVQKHVPGFYERYVKRPLDCMLATGALIVLSPVLLATAFLVRIRLGSPVIFTQERPGKDEKIFKLYKFRSMTDERDGNGELLPDEVRLTSFGKKLRSASLDELPELLNIIKGDMSIVGPRPLLVEYLSYYTEEERHRHDVRPGLTGWAQINGRNTTTWEKRLQQDIFYVNHSDLFFDCKIIFKTFYKVIKKSDILMGKEIQVGRLDVARKNIINIDGNYHISLCK